MTPSHTRKNGKLYRYYVDMEVLKRGAEPGPASRLEQRGCFPHAAGLHNGHQDVEVLQLHAASEALAQFHRKTYCNTDIV
jgi:hypothetical protein